MDAEKLKAAIRKGTQTGINEAEAKTLLKLFDIPVVPETIAVDAAEAVQASDEYGYPVVVKGLGSRLMHKTEQGLVKLNLPDETILTLALMAHKENVTLNDFIVKVLSDKKGVRKFLKESGR